MILRITICCWLIMAAGISVGQRVTIRGYIRDMHTGESLPGATVSVPGVEKMLNSNNYGFYSITLEKGKHQLICSFVGYNSYSSDFLIEADTVLDILMEKKAVMAEEVVLTARKREDLIRSTQLGKLALPMEQVRSMPALMGEVDVIRTLQLLPGVANPGEASAGFYVRGGGPDQNLILLDDAVVYNPGHLFGFFSIFNADAINSVTLIKGGMPAQYGGRLSSVLDITMKDGNNRQLEVDGGIGLIASRLSIQGPIKKGKSSFLLAGRRTYADAVASPFIGKSSPYYGSGYYFYDFNAKANFIINDRNRIFASGYFGRDVFDFANSRQSFAVHVPWGNGTGTIRWNHIFNKRLFGNTTAVYNDYRFTFSGAQNNLEVALNSGIRDLGLKQDFDLYPFTGHRVRFGGQYTFHRFMPSVVTGRQDSVIFSPGNPLTKFAHEAAVYLQDDWDISPSVRIQAGIRYSLFIQTGPYTRYATDINGNHTDSVQYAKGETVQSYRGLEPRLGVRFSLNQNSSLKFSACRNLQYIHLVSNSGSTLPTDLWVPSTLLVKPQESWLFAGGLFRNFKNNMYEASVELYYKTMDNQIEYEEGYTPNTLEDVENYFVFGKGWSYGAEWYINKKKGRLTGWLGYTLSWTWRKFPDLNAGEKFPAKFDRRHDISLVGIYPLNKRWKMSLTFVYGTGNAATLPQRFYFIDGVLTQEYSKINQYRLPSYHRTDLAFIYAKPQKPGKRFSSEWVFSVYNLYNRKNPYFIYYDTEVTGTGIRVQAKQVSIFPAIPSVTWNFKL